MCVLLRVNLIGTKCLAREFCKLFKYVTGSLVMMAAGLRNGPW